MEIGKSVLELYNEEQILLVLDYVDDRVNNNEDNNNDYWLHKEWHTEGNIKENIKYFKYLIRKLGCVNDSN